MRRFWNKLFGDRGERAAEKYLKRQGYRIISRNYSTPWGEIDIVALDGTTIVFVEVKTRQSIAAGHPFEAVTHEKQSKLTLIALRGCEKKIGRSGGTSLSADLAFVTEFSFYSSVSILSSHQRIRSETPSGSIDDTVHDPRTAR